MHEITPAQKFEKARLQLAMDKPFWGYLLYRFKAVREDARIKSMATDGRYLHYNPEWVGELDFDMLKSNLAHAVSSVALLHPFRRGARDLELYNEASDHTVNLGLIEDGSFVLPGTAPCDSRFAGMSVEQVYSILLSEQPPQPQGAPQPQQGGSGSGSASGAPSAQQEESETDDEGEQEQQPGDGEQDAESDVEDSGDEEQETDVDKKSEQQAKHESDASEQQSEGQSKQKPKPSEAPGTDQCDVLDFGALGEGDESQPSEAEQRQAEEDWSSAVASAVAQAEAAGHLSANQLRQIRKAFEETMSFEEYMMLFAKSLARDETSWTTRDRRFAAGTLYLPGRRSTKVGKLVYGVDTSGSIGEEELARFESAGRRVQEDLKPDETIVLYVDAEVCGEERFASGEELNFEHAAGGGGTNFIPFFERVRQMIEEGDDIVGMIYVTDLDGRFPKPEEVEDLPPVLWVSTEKEVAPFGETAYFHNK